MTRDAAELGRQVLRDDLAAGGRDREPAAHVDELAHVAGPVVTLQRFDGIRAQRLRRDAELVGRLLEVEPRQLADVLAPLPQRRHLDAHDVQPVVEILAEPPRRGALPEVLVRRRDDAHVDA